MDAFAGTSYLKHTFCSLLDHNHYYDTLVEKMQ
jgi:hypothetical protein